MKKLIAVLCLALFALTLNAQGPTGRAVTQTGSITTGVTINADTGVITTVSATTPGASVSTFTVTNSACTASSTVQLGVQGYGGTLGSGGLPVVVASNVANGSFNVNLINAHASNALNNVVTIGFIIR